MLREMSGQHVQDWLAYFSIQEDERRDAALDAKGKASLRAHMSK